MKKEIEGTKGVIRIRKQKGRQPNDQENKCTTRQKYTQKTDDREIQTPLNINDA